MGWQAKGEGFRPWEGGGKGGGPPHKILFFSFLFLKNAFQDAQDKRNVGQRNQR
jgi:hypothetical protein